jgi:leucyl aminopeptidase
MNYALNQIRPKELAAQCAVVGLYDERMLTSACAEFDELCGGAIKALIESGDLTGKLGQTQMLFNLSGLKTSRILVVGLGEQRKFDATKYIKVNKDAQRALKTASASDAVSYLAEIEVPGKDIDWKLTQSVLLADYAHYRYTATLKNKGDEKLKEIRFTAPITQEPTLVRALAMAAGVKLARELGNLPPNICTPAFLAEQAQAWGRSP